jgi:hypothetical protein
LLCIEDNRGRGGEEKDLRLNKANDKEEKAAHLFEVRGGEDFSNRLHKGVTDNDRYITSRVPGGFSRDHGYPGTYPSVCSAREVKSAGVRP